MNDSVWKTLYSQRESEISKLRFTVINQNKLNKELANALKIADSAIYMIVNGASPEIGDDARKQIKHLLRH
jgi:hypothetical protein